MRRNSKQERERERAGDARMFRAWKRFHRDERDTALTGPHARTLAVGELTKEMLRNRGISDEDILERIEHQLEERQQEYDAEGFIWRLRDASEQSR